MSNTISNNIPFVPENTIDPAAGLNLSLNTIDALLQVLVQTVGANSPPGSPTNGARYIVGTSPTGAWAGQANKLARYLDSAWQFFNARYALNAADGSLYVRSASTWAVVSGGGGGSGTVTSVALSAPTGFAVAGSPVTASGTLALSFAAGYSLPANADQTNWNTAYGWGNHASAGYQKQLVAGANITIDDTDPDNPIISASGGGGGGSFDRLSNLTAAEVSISSATTLTSTAFGKLHICSGSTDYTVVLPTASGNAGKIIGFRVESAAAAFITADGSGSETVDGKSAFVIRAGEVLSLLSDGTNFKILDYRHCKVFAATKRTAVQSVAGSVFTKVQLNVIEGSAGNIGGGFDITTFRFTAKRTRRHTVLGNLCLLATTSGDALSPRIYVNGVQVRYGGYSPALGGTIIAASFSAELQLAAGDYVELYVYNHAGAARDIPANFDGCCNMTIAEDAE